MTKSSDVFSWHGCVWRRWRYRQHSDSVVIWQVGVEAKPFLPFPLLSSLGKLCGCNNNWNIEGRKNSLSIHENKCVIQVENWYNSIRTAKKGMFRFPELWGDAS